jgi:hypothetical protein
MTASTLRWHDAGAVYLVMGGALYLVGTFLVTLAFNVPKNRTLASVAPTEPEGARLWAGYFSAGQPGTMFARQPRLRHRRCSPSRSVVERRTNVFREENRVFESER